MMVYFWIFVFAAWVTFGLVHSEEAPFTCPECQAVGPNADSECEANIENKPCTKEDSVCQLIVSSRYSEYKMRLRRCRSRYGFDFDKRICEFSSSCAVAMCSTSGCKAEIEPFMCPECRAKGENAESECETNIENKPCLLHDPVCVLSVIYKGPARGRFRTCLTRNLYKNAEYECQKSGNCSMSMCDTSGCKAAEPPRPFLCPVCDDCEVQSIENKPCLEEDPACILYVSTKVSP
ncbi:uncharacterized protein LOC144666847 isoform X1 [Oculina patagonica]